MKKKLLIVTGALLAAASVCFLVYINKERNAMSDLFFANVEALTSNEGGNHKICYYESVVKVGYTYYDCGKCQMVYDEKGRGRISKCF